MWRYLDNEVQKHDVGVNLFGIAEYFNKVSSAWFLTSHVLSEFNTGSATKCSNFFNKTIAVLHSKLKHENMSSTILVSKCLLCSSATVCVVPSLFSNLVRHVQDCGRRLHQTKYRMLEDLSFLTCRDLKRQGRNRRVTRQAWLHACFIHRLHSRHNWRFRSAIVRKVPIFYWCCTIKMQYHVFIYILCLVFNYFYH